MQAVDIYSLQAASYTYANSDEVIIITTRFIVDSILIFFYGLSSKSTQKVIFTTNNGKVIKECVEKSCG